MKGKSTFTAKEIEELKRLINKKSSLPSDEQKAIRDKMRKMQFYITDFTSSNGFESSDLQELIERGVIKIAESNATIDKGSNIVNSRNTGNIQREIINHYHPASSNVALSSFDRSFLTKHGFHQCITYCAFKNDPRVVKSIPDIMGVYVVISPSSDIEFLPVGTGGHFKEKDPNVSVKTLAENWINDANIVYIGKAGGVSENGTESNSTLRKRLNTYFKFGSGEPVGHWGGRFIWQLKHSDDLLFFWRTCDESENPVILEHTLIEEFSIHYGRFPFANLKA